MQLYPFQLEAVERTIAALPRNPICVSPTGSGKTTIACEVVKQTGTQTIWITHREELITQAADRLTQEGLFVGIIAPGHPHSPLAQVQVASVQTLVNRKLPPAKTLVIDECHHSPSASFTKIINAYGPDCARLGLTATPFRLDGRGLGDLFGEIVTAASTRELCDLGILHAPRVYASRIPDLRGVKVVMGDYGAGLADRVNKAELVADIPQTWLKHAAGLPTVAFAVDVAHSQAICEAFRAVGVAAEHIDGAMNRGERAMVLRRLALGQTQVVSNCMILTEGWDLPALECAIIARPTASLCLHLQMIGRVMRWCPGKVGALVLDHAGNTHVHGLVTRQIEYTLDGRKVGESEPLGLRRCTACGLFYEPTEPCCPECGAVGVAAGGGDRTAGVHGAGELSEYEETFEYRRDVWRLLEAEREACGWKDGWAWFRYRERFNQEPVLCDGPNGPDLVDVSTATLADKEQVYLRLRRIAAERGFKDGWASHQYRQAFGVWPSGFVGRARIAERFKARAGS